MALLELKDVVVTYQGARALTAVNLTLEAGEIAAVIGANGAGKTTCLRTISGLKRIDAGEIWFDGQRIDAISPRATVARGVVHVPEGKRLFPRMSVRENLEMGTFLRRDARDIAADFTRVFAHFPILKERQKQAAGSLSGGEQQLLAFARGLMARPKVLLVDEPTVGVAPLLVKELGRTLGEINRQGVAILLVEQNAAMALRLAQRGYVLETGSIVLSGKSDELLQNDYVRKSYLGK
jgi:branched-chain amino acid transport system ATP-binding protein